ncbi:MAG TPA: hypothetical protein VK989_13725 [Polyangia bacterium]|nr:hypothetical protein [Polyangia bacterium]
MNVQPWRLAFVATIALGCGAGGGQAGNGDAGAPAGHAGQSLGAAGSAGAPGTPGEAGTKDGGASSDAPAEAPPDATGAFPGDTFLPWAGGSAYYGKWAHGPSSDPSFYPIMVWLQSPPNATRYKNVGINFFVGLDNGPTDDQLMQLAKAGVPTICDQSGVWKAHAADATIAGWLQPDEPDNAQDDGHGGYDPCIAPATIVAGYTTMVANDATRPVMLGLGRGVSDTTWVGRGTCTGMTGMYTDYAKGGDILAFDIYPVNSGLPLEAVPAGVDNLIKWSGGTKPVIADIEASNIDNTTRPSPAQIRSEVWMAIVHGAAGTQYFCHRFTPTFSETDCLDDAPTAAALKSINAQLVSLAPALNSPPVGNGVAVTSSSAAIPVDVLLKRQGGATYLFATQMRAGTTTATFTLARFPATASAEVLGESRTLPVTNGVFKDDFEAYGVHLYKITF